MGVPLCRVAVIVAGSPGSGKGVQGRTLSDHYGFERFESGETVRKLNAAGLLPKQASDLMGCGELIHDDDMILGILKNFLLNHNGNRLVIDGIPRTIVQADRLPKMLYDAGFSKIILLHLCLPPDVAIERIMQDETRRGIRLDNAEDVIRHRLKIYEKETLPAILRLAEHPCVDYREIDSSVHKDQVVVAVLSAINHFMVQGSFQQREMLSA